MKKKIALISVATFLVLLIGVAVFLIATKKTPQEKKCNDILKYISQDCDKRIKLRYVSLDEEKKEVRFTYVIDKYGWDNGHHKYEAMNKLRIDIDDYLLANRSYFLNNGYDIGLAFRHKTTDGEATVFSNVVGYKDNSNSINNYIKLKGLNMLSTSDPSIYNDLQMISDITNDLNSISLEISPEDFSVFSGFPELKFVFIANQNYTQDMYIQLKKVAPNAILCQYPSE